MQLLGISRRVHIIQAKTDTELKGMCGCTEDPSADVVPLDGGQVFQTPQLVGANLLPLPSAT